MEERWLMVDDICKYLNLSKAPVYKWIEQRDMSGHKIDRFLKFKKDKVDQWVREGGARDSKEGEDQ